MCGQKAKFAGQIFFIAQRPVCKWFWTGLKSVPSCVYDCCVVFMISDAWIRSLNMYYLRYKRVINFGLHRACHMFACRLFVSVWHGFAFSMYHLLGPRAVLYAPCWALIPNHFDRHAHVDVLTYSLHKYFFSNRRVCEISEHGGCTMFACSQAQPARGLCGWSEGPWIDVVMTRRLI